MSRNVSAWLGVFVSALAFFALLTHDSAFLSGNDASRLAQIESLVDHGQGNIDASRYRWTKDRVTIDGKNYSNKPPLLAIAGAAAYAVIKPATGIGFGSDEPRTIYWLTLIVIGVQRWAGTYSGPRRATRPGSIGRWKKASSTRLRIPTTGTRLPRAGGNGVWHITAAARTHASSDS